MKNALFSTLWLVFGLLAAFALMPIIEEGIRLAFKVALSYYQWIAANPERFTFFAILGFTVWTVIVISRANAPRHER